jgi:Raf kinase inhibitor-like YbhB/YbcL family protein
MNDSRMHRRAGLFFIAALVVVASLRYSSSIIQCFVPVRGIPTAIASSGAPMKIESSAFEDQANIPRDYTCQGADSSPELKWSAPPEGTKSLALIVDDPDAPAGTWVHWVMWNLPATLRGIPAGVAKNESLPDGTQQGVNDFKRIGYGGPCPPPGSAHRYYFKLYALDTVLNLKPKSTKAQLEQAMQGHILAQSQLMGKYQRS